MGPVSSRLPLRKVNTITIASVHSKIQQEVFCASMFLTANLHFVRLQQVVESVVSDMLDVKYTDPDGCAKQYAVALRDFAIRILEICLGLHPFVVWV